MPTGYQIEKQDATYFVTFQVVYWIDLFSRRNYRDIIVENLNYCIKNKGLTVFSYVIMSNHIHLLIRAENENLSSVVRDFKKYTTARLIFEIENNSESRREWLLLLFKKAASEHKRNSKYQIWTHENHAEEVFSPKFYFTKNQLYS